MAAPKLRFLGGAGEIGRLAMLLDTDGARLLFDYGMAPSDPPKYPEESPPVDMAFLTHAHLDHSGMMAWVAGKHAPPTVMTPPTWAMSELLAHDALKVAKAEGYPIPYSPDDIRTLGREVRRTAFGEAARVDGLEVRLHSAGHIPGSTMYEVRGSRNVVFTGDLHTRPTRLVRAAKPVPCDVLVIEGTYAGREHPDREGVERRFLAQVESIADQGGVALVPAFAVGRSQEVLMLLADSGLEVWYDGMGRTVARLQLEHPEFLRNPAALEHAMKNTNIVRSRGDRDKALHGDVIVTTSGMLEGGPVLGYLDAVRDRTDCGVLLTGYQVEGTNGRRLLEEGVVDVHGVAERVRCPVERYDFSAHAGHSDLVAFIGACDPEDVVVMHSDQPQLLAEAIGDRYRVHTPKNGEDVVL